MSLVISARTCDAIINAKKLVVIGPPGAGKTTLSKHLGEIIEINPTHLDSLFWKPGWIKISTAKRLEILDNLVSADKWILDGNYEDIIDRQLAQCEVVIFLDFPRHISLWRVFKRRFWDKQEVAPGMYDKLNFRFLRTIWSFPHNEGKFLRSQLATVLDRIIVVTLRNPAEVRCFLQRMSLLQTPTDISQQFGKVERIPNQLMKCNV